MPDTTLYEQLKQKVQELSDNFDNLQFSFWKKTGSDSNSIQGAKMQSVNFKTGSTGWELTPAGNLEANSGTFRGALVANSLDIPDTTTADSFHVNTTGDTWWGATAIGSAVAKVLKTGIATFTNVNITGGAISGTPISSIPNNTTTDISLLEKSHNLVFSVTDADTIAWGAGTIVFSNGRTFTIDAGNTGNMAALTYIYLDPAVSSTVLQTTTTYSTAMGANKSLMGTAQNNTVTASFIPYGAGQPLIDGANIGALSIVAGLIAAGAITATKISVSQLSAIAADLGVITAGSININSGVASIDSAGAGVFKSIKVGGSSIQYTLNDNGYFSFGDGSDGAAVFNGTDAVTGASRSGTAYTLTRDVYYTDATLSTGVTINPAGYRIFGTGTLTLNGTAKIFRDGNAGTAGTTSGGQDAAGGAALADGYLKGSLIGGKGGDSQGVGDSSAGGTGGNTSNSLGSNGAAGGAGGAGSGTGATAAGGGGTATASNVSLIANWHLATMLDIGSTGATVKFDNSAAAGGGGGGGSGATNQGGGGGGGGSAGGIIAIYFRNIVIGASASMTANGGNGGAGGNGSTTCGGGGGGGGGNGGQIILVYNTLTNSGSLTASAGTGGAAGAGGGSGGLVGTAGTNGTAGTIRSFQISL